MTKPRECPDCIAEGRDPRKPKLNAPYPGPRCHRHQLAHKKAAAAVSAARRRAATYGITPEQYEALLVAQGGGCAICGRRPSGRRLAVDHDHACCPGKTSCGRCVRGLLCWTENKWLHHIGDNPAVAERAANYLRNPPARAIAASVQVR
jgi:hypothetical protein